MGGGLGEFNECEFPRQQLSGRRTRAKTRARVLEDSCSRQRPATPDGLRGAN